VGGGYVPDLHEQWRCRRRDASRPPGEWIRRLGRNRRPTRCVAPAFDEWRRRLLKYSILGALLAGGLFLIPILQYGIGSPGDLFNQSTPATQVADSTAATRIYS
jgi:hypothetical protein